MQIGLILVALAFPLLEIAVLIKVGQSIGFWWTVLLLAGTGVAGGLIVHQQGLSAARRAVEAINEGRPPIEPVVDSLMLMVAGTLLLIPGLITDVAGLALLVPPLRRAIARSALRRMISGADIRVETREWRSPGREEEREGGPARQAPIRPTSGNVIDGEWERVEEPKPPGERTGKDPGKDRGKDRGKDPGRPGAGSHDKDT